MRSEQLKKEYLHASDPPDDFNYLTSIPSTDTHACSTMVQNTIPELQGF